VLEVFESMSDSNSISGGNGSKDVAETRVLISKALKRMMVEIEQVRTY
jgi:hypothetical protein